MELLRSSDSTASKQMFRRRQTECKKLLPPPAGGFQDHGIHLEPEVLVQVDLRRLLTDGSGAVSWKFFIGSVQLFSPHT